ncbi:MAG TPA: formate dehydrogenase subunit gamma [Vicinamibacteria bacterium]|nr:formate dehydrogenase subunit gamma [Vicinamibacteria bacterium]
MDPKSATIERFSFAERAAHWLSAMAFVYAALSGLALWSPRLYWISDVLGGGVTVRGWHPWGGVLFFVALGIMFRNWAHDMRIEAEDREWLANVHRFAVNEDKALPPAGRFNAGQKVLFWIQSVSAAFLLASGAVLWFPEWMPRGLRLAAVLIHPTMAVVAIAGIILHVYMGTAAIPGAFRGMLRGFVTREWAESHHAKWYRETKG